MEYAGSNSTLGTYHFFSLHTLVHTTLLHAKNRVVTVSIPRLFQGCNKTKINHYLVTTNKVILPLLQGCNTVVIFMGSSH